MLPGADGLRDSAGTVAGVVGITAGGTYVLCRDYLRLRYRRSIGKVLFDLRPFSVRDTVPRPMGVWSSVRRNIVPPLFLLLLTSSWLLGLFALLVIPVLLIGGAVYLSWTWVKKRESLGSRWSMTRVLDSDSAEALAVRP